MSFDSIVNRNCIFQVDGSVFVHYVLFCYELTLFAGANLLIYFRLGPIPDPQFRVHFHKCLFVVDKLERETGLCPTELPFGSGLD